VNGTCSPQKIDVVDVAAVNRTGSVVLSSAGGTVCKLSPMALMMLSAVSCSGYDDGMENDDFRDITYAAFSGGIAASHSGDHARSPSKCEGKISFPIQVARSIEGSRFNKGAGSHNTELDLLKRRTSEDDEKAGVRSCCERACRSSVASIFIPSSVVVSLLPSLRIPGSKR
jgi:hypothetical protein